VIKWVYDPRYAYTGYVFYNLGDSLEVRQGDWREFLPFE
jgi:hypothetical protein